MEYGLIGKNIDYSFSPYIHSLLGYDYGVMNIEREKLSDFFAKKDFSGVNVTVPYKKEVIKYLDKVDETALRCGAVNTVINDNGVLTGYNTDFCGLDEALKRAGITLRDRNVIICGSGGAAETAKFLAEVSEAKRIKIVSRKGEINYENVYENTDTEVIIDATPVGTTPYFNEKILDLSRFPNLTGVFDLTYNPLKTALIKQAESLGLRSDDGLYMLVKQACVASELFKKTPVSAEKCDYIYEKVKKSMTNIVLIGMPGCGKTTVGKKLAKITGREFFDVDEIIEKEEKTTIAEIFAKKGEKYFRTREKETVKMLSLFTGKVIATGGGSVADEENVDYLSRNGVFVWIKRDLSLLCSDGRPLLSDDMGKRKKLFSERKPFYEKVADMTVDGNLSVEAVAKVIAERF